MNTWEYKTFSLPKKDSLNFNAYVEKHLNRLGAHGWELVNVVSLSGTKEGSEQLRFVLKRPYQSCLTPYIQRGYSEKQLDAIYTALTPGEYWTERPLDTVEVDLFLKRYCDEFEDFPQLLRTYHAKLVHGCDEKEIIDAIVDKYYQYLKEREETLEEFKKIEAEELKLAEDAFDDFWDESSDD